MKKGSAYPLLDVKNSMKTFVLINSFKRKIKSFGVEALKKIPCLLLTTAIQVPSNFLIKK